MCVLGDLELHAARQQQGSFKAPTTPTTPELLTCDCKPMYLICSLAAGSAPPAIVFRKDMGRPEKDLGVCRSVMSVKTLDCKRSRQPHRNRDSHRAHSSPPSQGQRTTSTTGYIQADNSLLPTNCLRYSAAGEHLGTLPVDDSQALSSCGSVLPHFSRLPRTPISSKPCQRRQVKWCQKETPQHQEKSTEKSGIGMPREQGSKVDALQVAPEW